MRRVCVIINAAGDGMKTLHFQMGDEAQEQVEVVGVLLVWDTLEPGPSMRVQGGLHTQHMPFVSFKHLALGTFTRTLQLL